MTRRHIPEEQELQLHRCESLTPRVVHCTKVSDYCEDGNCLYRLTLEKIIVRFFETSGHIVASQSCGIFYVERLPHKLRGLNKKADFKHINIAFGIVM